MAVTFALCFCALLIQLTMVVMKKLKHYEQAVSPKIDFNSTSVAVSLSQALIAFIRTRIHLTAHFSYI